MEYLSVREAAEKWGVSGALVRRLCKEGSVSGAILQESGWKIPGSTPKPVRKAAPVPKSKKLLPPLARKLQIQKKKKNYHGLYDYVQVELAYCSNRMASNRLTRKNVDSIFRKGKVSDMFEPMKVSDMIEVMNHCICLDYVLDRLDQPLSAELIKEIHYQLTYGTMDSRLSRVFPGEYRTKVSARKELFIGAASRIAPSIRALVRQYESTGEKELVDLLEFHVNLGRIFPFEDYNGRMERLILLKECLRHDIMPFILDDKRRGRYLDGLSMWGEDQSILTEVVREAQERFKHQLSQQALLAHGQRFLPKGSLDNYDSEKLKN